jgi:hypothetical protein
MYKLIFLFIFLFSTLHFSNAQKEGTIGIGCGVSKYGVNKVKLMERLIISRNFDAIRNKLSSNNSAEKCLAIIITQILDSTNKIQLTNIEKETIRNSYDSQFLVHLCADNWQTWDEKVSTILMKNDKNSYRSPVRNYFEDLFINLLDESTPFSNPYYFPPEWKEGISFSRTMYSPIIARMDSLVLWQDFQKIRKKLNSNNNAEKCLSIIISELLNKEGLIELTKTELDTINKSYISENSIPYWTSVRHGDWDLLAISTILMKKDGNTYGAHIRDITELRYKNMLELIFYNSVHCNKKILASESIVFNCQYIRSDIYSEKSVDQLLFQEDFDAIRQKLLSHSPAEQCLSVIICEMLTEDSLIELTYNEKGNLKNLYDSKKLLYIYEDCKRKYSWAMSAILKREDSDSTGTHIRDKLEEGFKETLRR